jgi:AcrR family transcriptional regulator
MAVEGRRERKKQQMRQLIAETAYRLFLERGFDRVSIAEIAHTADVAEATVFNYFRTKEDLVFNGLQDYETDLLDSVKSRAPGEPALAAFARFALEPSGLLADSDPATATQLARVGRMIASSPALLDREQRIFAAYTDSLARLLADETGVGPEDLRPCVAANAMIGVHRALIQLVRERVQDPDLDRKRLARDVRRTGRAAIAMLDKGLASYAPGRQRARPHTVS